MRKILRLFFILFFLTSTFQFVQAQDCGCDHVITPPVERATTLIIYGDSLGVKPGQKVCLTAGFYMQIRFLNMHGEPGNPVTIQNCGGQVVIGDDITYGRWWAVDLAYSSYVRLTGSGAPGLKYGIRLGRSGDSSLKIGASTDTEIDHLEIANSNFAGILAKTDYRGNVPPDAPEMNNVNIHDNYIHDTRGEGMYIGETTTPGQNFRHLEIWNNIITRTGFDLLQVANAVEDVKVHHNVLYKSGLRAVLYQNKGLQIGDNSVGEYYNNFVIGSASNSMIVMGMGDIDIYNNYFQGAGDPGFYVDNRKITMPGAPIKIRGNYLMEVRETAPFFNIFNELNPVSITGNRVEGNNVLINTDPLSPVPIVVNHSDNQAGLIERVQFTDVTIDDFTLPENSPYKGIGVSGDVTGRNNRPFIAIIAKQILDAETTRQIPVKAGDADGDALRLEAFNLPPFVSFADNGDGTGVFKLAPQLSDIGVYHKVRVRVTDAKGGMNTQNYTIRVTDPYAFIATANASTENNGPENTLDTNMSTRWECPAPSGNWIHFDLREDKLVSDVQIAFHNGDSIVQAFIIETSLDNVNWVTVLFAESSGATAEPETFLLGELRARYLRITDAGHQPNSYNEVVINCKTAPVMQAFTPSADVYSDGTTVYDNSVLRTKYLQAVTYLRFDVSGLNVAKLPVIGSKLTITAVQNGYGKVGVYLGRNTAWTETCAVHELPGRGKALTSLTTNFVAGQKYELDLGDAVQDNGMLNIILVGPNGGLTFSSSEGGNKPELRVVTLRGGLATEEMTTMTAKVETSTATTDWQEQLKVYPNPFEDQIAVAFDEEIIGGMTVEVLDRSGRPVVTENRMNPGKAMVLDIRHLNMHPGMYFLKVKVNGIEAKTLRIFKR